MQLNSCEDSMVVTSMRSSIRQTRQHRLRMSSGEGHHMNRYRHMMYGFLCAFAFTHLPARRKWTGGAIRSNSIRDGTFRRRGVLAPF